MTHYIFVYGTLKRGLYSAHKLTNPENGSATFVGTAKTIEKWPLVITTEWNMSFLLDKPGYGKHVIGEVYKVDDKMLKFMDKLEYLYKRNKINVQILETDCATAGVEQDQITKLVCECFILENYNDHMLDLPHDELYDPNGNPRHECNAEKITLAFNEKNMKEVKECIGREVLKDYEKQAQKYGL